MVVKIIENDPLIVQALKAGQVNGGQGKPCARREPNQRKLHEGAWK